MQFAGNSRRYDICCPACKECMCLDTNRNLWSVKGKSDKYWMFDTRAFVYCYWCVLGKRRTECLFVYCLLEYKTRSIILQISLKGRIVRNKLSVGGTLITVN